MSRRQRLTFLGIAAAIAVVAVVLLAGGGAETGSPKAGAPTATATREPSKASPGQSATPTPTATSTPAPPLLSADDEKALTVTQGDTVRFRVRSETDEEVHVHGYDLKKDVRAGQTITFAFKADITGIFEIEFEKSATTLAQLKVVP